MPNPPTHSGCCGTTNLPWKWRPVGRHFLTTETQNHSKASTNIRMRRLAVLIIIFIGSVSFILSLNYASKKKEEYNFVRTLVQPTILPERHWDIRSRAHYIAGKVSTKIYLGNNIEPRKITIVETNLEPVIKEDTIKVSEGLRKASFITVDSNEFTVFDLVSYSVYKGSTMDWKATRFMNNNSFFAEAVPIHQNTIIVRTFRDTVREYVLAKKTKSPPLTEYKTMLLEKQIDGLFCTDGMLYFNEKTNQVVYVYYYRNQFITMDTSLNLLYRGTTIDPVTTARIKTARLKDGSVTLASPPYLVNNRSHTNGNYLFINSKIKAKNDDSELFAKTSVIDVYSLLNGTYVGSFYIPEFLGHKIKEFKVFDSTLVAIQGHYLVTYTLPNLLRSD